MKAISEGYQQKEIHASAYQYQKAIETGDKIVIGVNKFQVQEEPPKGLLRVDARVMEEQKIRLQSLNTPKEIITR